MARAPFIVFVYPYIKTSDVDFEYALLKSAERGNWEAVAGGGEDKETLLEAAKRETFEETGIQVKSPPIQLDTIAPVPVTRFKESYSWGNVYVIPIHYFSILTGNRQILLSDEHSDFKWLKYPEARDLLKFEDDKIALWELDRRVRGLGPKD